MKNGPNRTSASGRYKVAVVESETGKTVWEMPVWRSNLILTKGMDKKADLPWEDLFTYACAGAGTTSNYISTGTTVWSHSGFDVYSDGKKFVDLSAGSIVLGDTLVVGGPSLPERCIVAISSGTSFLVDSSMGFISGPFSGIYFAKSSRTALDVELKRTNDWFTGWPYCGTVINGAQVCMRRTFDFDVESTQTTYGEVGFTWSPDPSEGLFSRVVLDTTVTVDSGYYLRAFYELQVEHGPFVPTVIAIPIGTISDNGFISLQSFNGTCTSYVATSGSSSGTPLVEGLEKNSSPRAFLSDSQAVLHSFGTNHPPNEDGPLYAEVPTMKEPYRDKSFYFVRQATWTPGEYVGTINLFGMRGSVGPTWESYFCALHTDYAGTGIPIVASDQIQVRWVWSWSRFFNDIPM